jgi:hypothetical protein
LDKLTARRRGIIIIIIIIRNGAKSKSHQTSFGSHNNKNNNNNNNKKQSKNNMSHKLRLGAIIRNGANTICLPKLHLGGLGEIIKPYRYNMVF